MLKKLNYRPVIEYGVLTGIRRNSIVLEGDEPVTGFQTAKELQDHVKANKVPVRTGPIYQHIKDTEKMKQFIRDAGMSGKIDLRRGLDDLRADVQKIMEPERKVADEKVISTPAGNLLN